jgi:hypothetical protein
MTDLSVSGNGVDRPHSTGSGTAAYFVQSATRLARKLGAALVAEFEHRSEDVGRANSTAYYTEPRTGEIFFTRSQSSRWNY